jgi:antitoxin MazE
MQTTVQKWGNSLAVRISVALARESGISEGTMVDIIPENHKLVIQPLKKKYSLSELLEKINSGNLHKEIETGAIKGNEVW